MIEGNESLVSPSYLGAATHRSVVRGVLAAVSPSEAGTKGCSLLKDEGNGATASTTWTTRTAIAVAHLPLCLGE